MKLGPVDYLVVEFPPATSNFTGEMAAELAALAEAGTIRVLDVLILTKDNDGAIEAFEIDDLDAVDELVALEGEIAEILAAEDVAHLAEAMETAPPPASSSGRTAGQPRSHRRPACRWTTDRIGKNSDPGDHRIPRGRRGLDDRRRLTCRYVPHEPPAEVLSAHQSREPLQSSAPQQSSPRRQPAPGPTRRPTRPTLTHHAGARQFSQW